MFGVILWVNSTDRKAVIWCEDEGDLAYFEDEIQPIEAEKGFFDAGDYVEFDVMTDKKLRRASNPIAVFSIGRDKNDRSEYDFVSGTSAVAEIADQSTISPTVVQLSDHRKVLPTPTPTQISHLG